MKIEGGCLCGEVRYSAEGDTVFKGQCHCRECQYISGGNANVIVGMPSVGFKVIKGTPKDYAQSDLVNPVTRSFCPTCGTHLISCAPGLEGAVIIKVGTFDDPTLFIQADIAIWTVEMQNFHHIAEGVPSFDRFPPQA